ncbi:hypothetical protein LTS18_005332 [Coniosporium uncinatum]|uniref:Uncharacterized protein n=1 Tax=Coniosporium uncinatum TaxID=93489 RepID=A0ACC3D571_9PEZI|nr:hypothetical protein LTS18_005332 [Coniosporium uncinatum]
MTTPNATKSTITDHTVHPSTWTAHPTITRSVLSNCTFTDLTASTTIDRSTLRNVALTSITSPSGDGGGGNGKSKIDRSNCADSSITDAVIEHVNILADSVIHPSSTISRSSLTASTVLGVKIERSSLTSTTVSEASVIERSTLSAVSVSGVSTVSRSNVAGGRVVKATVDRCSLNECDVEDCTVERSSFSGMVMRNGIWRDGELKGRRDWGREVVVLERGEWEEKVARGEMRGEADGVGEGDLIDLGPGLPPSAVPLVSPSTTSRTLSPAPSAPSTHTIGNGDDEKHRYHFAESTPVPTVYAESDFSTSGMLTPTTTDSYSVATGLEDEDRGYVSGEDGRSGGGGGERGSPPPYQP